MFDFGKTLTLQGLLAVVIAMLILSPALANPIAPPSDPSHNYSDPIVFDPTDPVWEGADWVAVAEHYNKGRGDIYRMIAYPNAILVSLLVIAVTYCVTKCIDKMAEAIEEGWIGLWQWGDRAKFESWVTSYNNTVDVSECGGADSYSYDECLTRQWKKFIQAFVKESNKCNRDIPRSTSFDAYSRTTWECRENRTLGQKGGHIYYWDASSYISNLPPRSGGSGGGVYR